MAQEVQRLIQALRSTAGHVHELDDETARWCAAQLDEHFALLSRATAQYAAVVPRRIEYTSSLAYARLRWDSEWSAVERQRSSAEAWTYVHRLARWWAGHGAHNEHYLLWYFTQALLRPEFVHWAAEPDVTRALTALTAVHLVSLDEADSPIKPLIALAERGVFSFALPGAATLLYVPTCRGERGVAHCSDQAEAPFLRALAVDPGDHQVRIVYADLLEQHGELARAERLREEASGSVPSEPRIKRVEQLFGDARAVFLPRQTRPPEVRLMTASGQPPAGAHLEAGELSFPLAHANMEIAVNGGAIEVKELGSDPSPKPHVIVILMCADGSFWLRMRSYHLTWLNDAHVDDSADRPLFDGDSLDLLVGEHKQRFVFRLTAKP